VRKLAVEAPTRACWHLRLRARLKSLPPNLIKMEDRQAYDTDLSDAEWDRLEPFVPRPPKPGGRPPKHARREIVNGICYAIRSGGAWKLVPHDLPPWRTVYYFGSGAGRGSGSESMTPCANGCGRRMDERANPAGRCWTASQCEPVNHGARVGMMGPRNRVGASVTCSWIRWDWCCS
jgi:transposase